MRDPGVYKIENILRSKVVMGMVGLSLLVGPVLLIWLLLPWIKPVLSSQFWFSIIMMAVSLFIIIHACAACILFERKISAFIQDRMGPNRVGFWGVLQPVADGIKFILKEDIIPDKVDKPLFVLAPALAFVIALLGFAVIPWAGMVHWPWDPEGKLISTQAASVDIGILYVLAIGAMSVYGVVLAGWASNSKYAFYGAIRATAQMLSYEVPLGLGLLCMLLVAGTLRPEIIVDQQANGGIWNVFLQPIAFYLVLISAFAETNRTPFDLAEAEQELVAGYHVEYSAMKFGLFFLAEYAHMITGSALMIAVFFGGWAPLPFTGWLSDNHAWWAMLIKFGIFWGKIAAFLLFYMLIRWTVPRFRFDQLMRLAWRSMVPLGMGVLVGTAILTAMGLQRNLLASLTMNAIVLGIALLITAKARQPVTGRQEDMPEIQVAPTGV